MDFLNNDFDFDDGTKGLSPRCSFCGNEIEGMPLHTSHGDYIFCDLACAKLYNDLVNEIDIDKNSYDSYYEDNMLSEKASSIYRVIRFSNFKCLPHVSNYRNIDRDKLKVNYVEILKTVIR